MAFAIFPKIYATAFQDLGVQCVEIHAKTKLMVPNATLSAIARTENVITFQEAANAMLDLLDPIAPQI